MPTQHVIFFDGYCGLCDAAVSRLIPYARAAAFRFAPLQGATFRKIEGRFPELVGVDSVVFVENYEESGRERAVVKGAAVLGILRRMPVSWAPLRGILACVPSGLRDFLYDLIAKQRSRISGRRESCRVPTPEERELFLP